MTGKTRRPEQNPPILGGETPDHIIDQVCEIGRDLLALLVYNCSTSMQDLQLEHYQGFSV